MGARNTLSDDDIRQADVVIIAADIELDLARFNGKRLYRTSTSMALKKPEQTLTDACNSATVYGSKVAASSSATKTELPLSL